uniref:Integrase, catalytic region, zinc finger, CCHC-type, peptidase aspartic, catalytic n=1 Tax=Tanacetum cinerariifolium TaxID=118510 RepID=A0A6L2K619_TANCI|nr:integrase, catalytic region, zinc finger, CCHC-type, peptidase aspartic, catalytic [Tanacetum cinerariifolium]
MTRQRLHTNSEACMYALTVSTIEPKNIKEAMADHSWIESMQDELNQFERLQVWELVPRPEGKNIISLKWLWKNKCDAKNIVKHGLDECVSISTPMETERLDVDLQGAPTDQTTYRRMIGGLMYLTASRPDIAYATFVCACYQACPTVKHLKEVKRIFRYLRLSYNMGLWYLKDSGFKLIAYSDADHAGYKDDCKSTSRGLQFLGRKLMSWSSKKQDCIAMSTLEAKYVSLSACCAQVIWMCTQLLDYGYKNNRNLMYCDSKSAIAISCNPVQHSKTKHIDIRYHFIKEHVDKVIIMAQQQHVADVYPDGLCPLNKRYDLMDGNKKIDLEHVQCPLESKILTNIIKNHPEIQRQSWNEDSSLDDLRSDKAHGALSDVCGESSAPKRSTVIRFRIPQRRSTRLTPPTPLPTVDKADEMILQDTLQVSLTEHKSREEQKARENVELVNEHLASVEIEKMVKGQENVIDDSLIFRNDEHNILDTREKGKILEESRNSPFPAPIRSPRIYTDLVSSDTEKLQELTVTDTKSTPSSSSPSTKLSTTNRLLSLFKAKPAHFKRCKSFSQELQGRYGYLFEHLRVRLMQRKSFDTLADHLQEVMVDSLPTMVEKHVKEQVQKQVPEQARISLQIQKAIANDIPSQVDASLQQHDIAIWLALQMKFGILQKTSEYEAYVSGESSSGQDNEKEQGPSTSDDDEIPTKQVSQDIMEEVSLTIDEAKLRKIADEILRYRCTSGDEHQYHIDQMTNFLKSDIIWKSRKEILKGSSGPEKIVLSLHKFPAVIFNDDDIEEQTFRWTYWELGHEHKFITEIVARRANECIVSITDPDFKNLNKNDIEDMYLLIMNEKVPNYAETGLLCYLSVFIRSSVIWERVHDFQLRIESYQQKVNLTAPTISFLRIEKHKMFSIIYEPMHGIIYKNSKKEKRVMRHLEIHKFCDATLNRVLECLKSYNNDVKYGYIQKDLTKDEAEYLKLFEEDIKVRLKYRRQMRRWKTYVNGRLLGPQRERLE